MARKRLSQEERRNQIIRVAMALFAEKGFNGATTRSIAESAGVSEAIIFRHFATKEDLYDAIIAYTVQKRLNLWEQDGMPTADPENLGQLLEQFARAYIKRNREDPTFIRLMMYSALEDHKFRQRFLEIYRSPHLMAIRRSLEAGVEQGVFCPIDPGLTARSFFASLLQYCIQSFVARSAPLDQSRDEQMTQNLVAVYLNGLRVTPDDSQQ
jgi:AcrR family transcriptional regulator